jgi:hypothetical protein
MQRDINIHPHDKQIQTTRIHIYVPRQPDTWQQWLIGGLLQSVLSPLAIKHPDHVGLVNWPILRHGLSLILIVDVGVGQHLLLVP